jgi:redox-sensitive bicupin YhaK (pirin superfamily)
MHRDSGGSESIVTAGGVQWMTALEGVSSPQKYPLDHFNKYGGLLEILLLWINY